MNAPCPIIRDLLPLYAEQMVSHETKLFVEEHLAACPACQKELEALRHNTIPASPNQLETVPMKKLKKTMLAKNVHTILLTASLSMAILLSLFSFLTQPIFIPYSQDLLTQNVSSAGEISIAFSQEVTGYSLSQTENGENGEEIFFVSAWSSRWDQWFSPRGQQNVTITPDSSQSVSVYYAQNQKQRAHDSLDDTSFDVLLYGTPRETGGVLSLPRLALNAYAALAFVLAVLLGILCLSLRKKKTAHRRAQIGFLIPLSYLMGHLCIKGLSRTTFCLPRDLLFILLVAACVYVLLFLLTSPTRSSRSGH